MKATYRFCVRGKLLSINSERKGSPLRRAEEVRQWRSDAFWEIKRARIPHLPGVQIIVQPFQCKSVLQDVGNCLPAVKPCVDALVDAGVLDGDGPEIVRSLTFLAPQRTTYTTDRLELELIL